MLTALSVGLTTERGTLPSVRKLPGLLSTSSYIKGLMENPLDKSGPAMINVCMTARSVDLRTPGPKEGKGL